MHEIFLGLSNNWTGTDEQIYDALINSLREVSSFKEEPLKALSRHCYVKNYYTAKLHVYYYEDITD